MSSTRPQDRTIALADDTLLQELDEWRLRRGLAILQQRDPTRAYAIVSRVREAVIRLSDGFPGDSRTGRPVAALDRLDPFLAKHRSLACPALDPENGRCELHDARPVVCRTFGPPLKFGDRKTPSCRLCFSNAAEDVTESCRFEPDPAGLEGEILRTLGAYDDESWETLIAFALVRDDVPVTPAGSCMIRGQTDSGARRQDG